MTGERGFYARGVLPWRVIPKARPRFNTITGRVYSDPPYAEFLKDAAKHIAYTTAGTMIRPGILRVVFNPNGCEWELQETCVNKVRGIRGDVDNLGGSVMDALQKAGTLKNDSLIRCLEATIP